MDAGCGTGILSELIDTSRFSYLGIDISAVSLSIAAKRKRHRVTFQKATIEGFVPPEPLDVLVFNEVLYYLNSMSVLQVSQQWLRQDGIVLVSCFDFPEGRQAFQQFCSLANVFLAVEVHNTQAGLSWHVCAAQGYRS
jgi:2-polyprenyl-3-methyl-5-hydroxy-6-metoxy-1,4-benzoquinol methylase